MGAAQPQNPVPFTHLLMAGAARRNKGLDLIAAVAVRWAAERRSIPLLVQVSKKHAARHGRREAAMAAKFPSSGYRGFGAAGTGPGRAQTGAGPTIAERPPAALASAIDRVLSDWHAHAARACAAARVLAREHDPRHLLDLIPGTSGAP